MPTKVARNAPKSSPSTRHPPPSGTRRRTLPPTTARAAAEPAIPSAKATAAQVARLRDELVAERDRAADLEVKLAAAEQHKKILRHAVFAETPGAEPLWLAKMRATDARAALDDLELAADHVGRTAAAFLDRAGLAAVLVHEGIDPDTQLRAARGRLETSRAEMAEHRRTALGNLRQLEHALVQIANDEHKRTNAAKARAELGELDSGATS